MIKDIIRLIRPQQWLKNLFVFLPLFFDRHIMDAEYIWPSVVAFVAFCFAASGVYCFNDIYDVEADRLKKKKCKRFGRFNGRVEFFSYLCPIKGLYGYMLKIVIIIAIIILFLIFIPFIRDMMVSKKDLAKNPIEIKFKRFFDTISEELMNGNGELTLFDDDPRAANIQDPNQKNLLIQCYYGIGNMTVILNYMCYWQELKWQKGNMKY